ncbi:hypothetical protein [Microbacterium lacticum]|uniref:hypothetical protein n=1 Tax=Microbacterium lacticum TaxID=33885 RepID=UPI001167F96A|nr:hypothetical protein [Microbacterium lacticum]GEB95272.1 hypothetical protein MLA01_14910 [Microbacterium lacticum]GGN14294.1 hypothetical protein GCM10009724_04750 [Microbacterium lacticum]
MPVGSWTTAATDTSIPAAASRASRRRTVERHTAEPGRRRQHRQTGVRRVRRVRLERGAAEQAGGLLERGEQRRLDAGAAGFGSDAELEL